MPAPSAAAVPSAEPSRYTATVLVASAVPDTVRAEIRRLEPFAGVVTTGAGGAVESIVQLKIAAALVCPPFLERICSVWLPSASPVKLKGLVQDA